jgi:O-antigen/teichoic acid export membrane protein
VIAIGMWFTIPAEWQDLRGPLAIILVGFVVAFPLRILPALLHGLQDLTFTGIAQMLSWMLSTAATVAMVLAGWNLVALALGWLISQVVTMPLFLYRMRTKFPGVLPHRLPPLVWEAVRPQLGKGFWISVAQVAQLLVANTDLLIIGKLLGPAAVVPYSCTGRLAGVLTNQAQILMQTATPGLCELKSIGSRERVFHALVAMTNAVLTFSGLVFCLVLLVNRWFVTWWVTGRQYGGFLLTIALALNFLIRSWTGTTAFSVFCFGYQRRISLTNISDGAVSVMFCVVLTMLWGPVGAAAGSMLGACLVSLPWNLWLIARDTGVSVPRLLSAMLRGWSWRFVMMAGAVFWVAMHWSPRNLPSAAAAVLAVILLYGLIMLPNVLRPPLGNYVRPLLASFRVKYAALQIRFSS